MIVKKYKKKFENYNNRNHINASFFCKLFDIYMNFLYGFFVEIDHFELKK